MELQELSAEQLAERWCVYRDEVARLKASEPSLENSDRLRQVERDEHELRDKLYPLCAELVNERVKWYVLGRNACPNHCDRQAFCDDASSETLIRVLEGLSSYKGTAGLGTWLASITLNTIMDLIRKEVGRAKQGDRRYISLDAPAEDGSESRSPFRSLCWVPPGDTPREGDRLEQIFKVIGQQTDLNNASNLVIRQRGIDGLTAKEVAAKRGTTPAAVDQMYSRDIRKYRELLRSRGIRSVNDL